MADIDVFAHESLGKTVLGIPVSIILDGDGNETQADDLWLGEGGGCSDPTIVVPSHIALYELIESLTYPSDDPLIERVFEVLGDQIDPRLLNPDCEVPTVVGWHNALDRYRPEGVLRDHMRHHLSGNEWATLIQRAEDRDYDTRQDNPDRIEDWILRRIGHLYAHMAPMPVLLEPFDEYIHADLERIFSAWKGVELGD